VDCSPHGVGDCDAGVLERPRLNRGDLRTDARGELETYTIDFLKTSYVVFGTRKKLCLTQTIRRRHRACYREAGSARMALASRMAAARFFLADSKAGG